MQRLQEKLEKLSIPITKEQIKQFQIYYDLLVEWNQKMNLTAITELDDVITKHFIDSVAMLSVVPIPEGSTMIDVGTGAGFPGIPLSIVRPDIQITLMDSLNKRVGFLSCVTEELGLQHVECIHSRAEDLARNTDYRESFDYGVSRAVANMSTLSEYCLPFIKKGGYLISYKQDDVEDEIKGSLHAMSVLGGHHEKTEKLLLPDTEIRRSFVLIKKYGSTPKAYPRKAGLPSKKPLS